jgi:hypothetical protein
MRIGKGNRSTRKKSAPVPLSAPQIPQDLTRVRTWPTVFGSRLLTAWAMAQPVVTIPNMHLQHTTWLDPYNWSLSGRLFHGVFSIAVYTLLNGRMIDELQRTWKKWSWSNWGTIPAICLVAKHEEPQSGELVSWLRFKLSTSWISVQIIIATPTPSASSLSYLYVLEVMSGVLNIGTVQLYKLHTKCTNLQYVTDWYKSGLFYVECKDAEIVWK